MTFDNIYNYFVCLIMFKVAKHINFQTFNTRSAQNYKKHNIIIELDMWSYTALT